jgi:NAD(P)-dependent dehydrogenase (short-subunit alcohol dehydrogenase family)
MTGKSVLVTGRTGGIGKATAIGLATLGARVGITGRDPARGERAAVDIRAASGNPAVDASSPNLDGITGQFFANRKPKIANKIAYETVMAARLWQVSADLVGMTPATTASANTTAR